MLEKLQSQLASEQPSVRARGHRKHEIYRLMRELQHRRRMASLRTQQGHVLRDKQDIAAHLAACWSSVMQSGDKSVDDIESYLVSKGLHYRVAK